MEFQLPSGWRFQPFEWPYRLFPWHWWLYGSEIMPRWYWLDLLLEVVGSGSFFVRLLFRLCHQCVRRYLVFEHRFSMQQLQSLTNLLMGYLSPFLMFFVDNTEALVILESTPIDPTEFMWTLSASMVYTAVIRAPFWRLAACFDLLSITLVLL